MGDGGCCGGVSAVGGIVVMVLSGPGACGTRSLGGGGEGFFLSALRPHEAVNAVIASTASIANHRADGRSAVEGLTCLRRRLFMR